VLATEEWRSVQLEEQQNEQLLDLPRQILALSQAIHELTEAYGTQLRRAGRRSGATRTRAGPTTSE